MGVMKALFFALLAVSAYGSVVTEWVEPEYAPDELPADSTSGDLRSNTPVFIESQATAQPVQQQPVMAVPAMPYYAPRYVPYAYPAPVYRAPQLVQMTPGSQVPVQPRFVSARAKATMGEGEAAAGPALPSPLNAPSASVLYPGPLGASFHLLHDQMGSLIPPYAQDPQYQRLGYYRPLSNKYSDGTSYPLNMQKFDYFPIGEGTA